MRAMLVIGMCLLAGAANAQMRDQGMRFERADSNSDGRVTKDEFMSMRSEAFASRDRSGDGFIDEKDLGKRAASRERVSQAMSALVAQLDKDGDRKVSKTEFVEGGSVVFARADADKNDAIDRKEWEAVKASLREATGR